MLLKLMEARTCTAITSLIMIKRSEWCIRKDFCPSNASNSRNCSETEPASLKPRTYKKSTKQSQNSQKKRISAILHW